MRFKFLILGLIILWHCNKILTQCYLQQLLTTKNNGVQLQTTTIDLREEILGFLSLTELLKQEKFLVRDNMIITRPGDETCVYLGEGYRLHDIQTTVFRPMPDSQSSKDNAKALLNRNHKSVINNLSKLRNAVTKEIEYFLDFLFGQSSHARCLTIWCGMATKTT